MLLSDVTLIKINQLNVFTFFFHHFNRDLCD